MSYEPIDPNYCKTCYMRIPSFEGDPYCTSEGKYWICNKCGIELGRCEIINDWYNKWGSILCRECYGQSVVLGINKNNKEYERCHKSNSIIPSIKLKKYYRMIRVCK